MLCLIPQSTATTFIGFPFPKTLVSCRVEGHRKERSTPFVDRKQIWCELVYCTRPIWYNGEVKYNSWQQLPWLRPLLSGFSGWGRISQQAAHQIQSSPKLCPEEDSQWQWVINQSISKRSSSSDLCIYSTLSLIILVSILVSIPNSAGIF